MSDGGPSAGAPDAVSYSLTTTDSGGNGHVEFGIALIAGTLFVSITDSQGNVSSVSEALV